MKKDEEKKEEEKGGYLVRKLKSGEGVLIADQIEIRLCEVSRDLTGAQIAIRAPRKYIIRKLER